MRLKIMLSLAFCTLALAACKTTENTTTTTTSTATTPITVAAPQAQNNEQANKELIMSHCEAGASSCACFADNLLKTLTPAQWDLLRAALTQADEPPAGTTDNDLQLLNEKLTAATQDCSM